MKQKNKIGLFLISSFGYLKISKKRIDFGCGGYTIRVNMGIQNDNQTTIKLKN